jgi:hypothetical protein
MMEHLRSNASLIEAIAAVIGVILSGFTIWVLVLTKRAAQAQADAALAQAEAAEALTSVSEEQKKAAIDSARRAAEANELERRRMLAEMTPLLVLERNPTPQSASSKFADYLVKNCGSGAAKNVVWCYQDYGPEKQPISRTSIGSRDQAIIWLDEQALRDRGIQVIFESMDNRRFKTEFWWAENTILSEQGELPI